MRSIKYKIDLKKIAHQCVNLIEVAQDNKWEWKYDDDTDCLYYSKKEIPKGTEPLTFKEDFSLFIDRESKIQGFYIEYFHSNLISHDKRFKNMEKIFDKKNKTNEIEKEHLVEIVAKDILGDIVENHQNENKIQAISFI